jgi:hypothetical protein
VRLVLEVEKREEEELLELTQPFGGAHDFPCNVDLSITSL